MGVCQGGWGVSILQPFEFFFSHFKKKIVCYFHTPLHPSHTPFSPTTFFIIYLYIYCLAYSNIINLYK
jgi:hypothetical protein